MPDDFELDAVQLQGDDRYYTSSPWEPDVDALNAAIVTAESWLEKVIGTKIPWEPIRRVQSEATVAEWRESGVYLVQAEVERLLLRWSDDFIYLAFVRGVRLPIGVGTGREYSEHGKQRNPHRAPGPR